VAVLDSTAPNLLLAVEQVVFGSKNPPPTPKSPTPTQKKKSPEGWKLKGIP